MGVAAVVEAKYFGASAQQQGVQHKKAHPSQRTVQFAAASIDLFLISCIGTMARSVFQLLQTRQIKAFHVFYYSLNFSNVPASQINQKQLVRYWSCLQGTLCMLCFPPRTKSFLPDTRCSLPIQVQTQTTRQGRVCIV
jgi:hypothetical protein